MSNQIGLERKPRKYPLSTLGHNIKWFMRIRQLKASVLAEDAGVGENVLSQMCHQDQRSPTIRSVQKVADALGVPIWALFMRPEELDETLIIKETKGKKP